jgi:hypothetical protein
MMKNPIAIDVNMYANPMTFAQDYADQKTGGTCMKEK